MDQLFGLQHRRNNLPLQCRKTKNAIFEILTQLGFRHNHGILSNLVLFFLFMCDFFESLIRLR